MPIGVILVFLVSCTPRGNEGDAWRGVPPPPIPPFAQHLQTGYPTSGDARWTRYDTEESFEVLHAFYRDALAGAAGRYRCTVTVRDPTCGTVWRWSDASRVLVFDQGTPGTASWQTFEIPIETDAQSGRHTVDVLQHLSDQLPQPSSTVASAPLHPLVGDWQATDPQAHSDFILRLDDHGHASVIMPFAARPPALRGTYHMDTTTLHMTLAASAIPDVQIAEPCVAFPSFFRNVCDASIVPTPTSPYPAPDATSTPTASPPIRLPASAYPSLTPLVVPTPTITRESRIETSFAVVLDGDTLILNHQSGSSQTFHKLHSK